MTDLALLGRPEHLEAVDRAIAKVMVGELVVLSVGGVAGSGRTAVLDEYEKRLRSAGIGTHRAALFPASVTHPGGLAHTLGISLEEPPTQPTALLVSDVQWADGTSMAVLQGIMARATAGSAGSWFTYRDNGVSTTRVPAVCRRRSPVGLI